MRIAAVIGVLLLGALAACAGEVKPSAKNGIEAEIFGDPVYGTRVSIVVEFPESRLVTGGKLVIDDRRLSAEPYPLDGPDPEPPPDPLPIKAGGRASFTASLPPTCEVPTGTPVFVVSSKPSSGKAREDRYAVSNVDEFRRHAEKVCRQGPQLSLNGSTTWPDGRFKIGLYVTNPGKAAHLVSREWRHGGTVWRAASADVPAGGSVTLQIHGTGQGCSHEGPWEHGQVTLDGVVLDPPAKGHADPC